MALHDVSIAKCPYVRWSTLGVDVGDESNTRSAMGLLIRRRRAFD
jgi:hypothetical protein